MRLESEGKAFHFLTPLWKDAEADKLDPLARLVYRSNKLGADQRITNTGGGNTSAKLKETDPLSGKPVKVLWVKGSGGDLRTSGRDNFASLRQDTLLGMQKLYSKRKDKGLKSRAEDDMVAAYSHATFNLNPRATSIDTPLHSFIPAKHVDHMHPNAVIAIAASSRCERLTREIFHGGMAFVKWMRPGFELGLAMQDICRKNKKARAIMMAQHGFISWADDDKECYFRTLEFIERASAFVESKYQARGGDTTAFGGQKFAALPEETRRKLLARILPWLRGRLGAERRCIATIQDDARMLRFVNSHDAPRLAELGTSCPDHFLRTKIKPLYVPADNNLTDFSDDGMESCVADLKARIQSGLVKYRKDYAAYYERNRRPNSPPMRDPNPTVILIPGLGMVCWGKDKSESRVTAEFYQCAVEVMRGAEAIDKYIALPQREAFDIEYWQLEEAKLKRMPAEKELARQVVIVIGAGSGIGRVVAHRIASEGAHVACVDVNPAAAQATAAEIVEQRGFGIGVAGSGVSHCGPALGLACDITNRASVRSMLNQVTLAYGGCDSIAITAGIFVPPDVSGHIPDDKWAVTFAVNVTGSYIVADEAAAMWEEQGLSGNLVLTTSANAVVAKRGSLAYDTSKAAANHLIRELAIQLSPLVRVNGVAPATVVEGSAMFPRNRVIASLAKYKIPFSEKEPTEQLTAKLANFYAERTLTRTPISSADQAEAFSILLTNRLSKTTGQIITVDGGLHEAFLR
ncbi:MAG TPA: bifunctional rhamnulose-1-phosphate aldolase/short-chain dehydrogenase [Verrucomicrobiae bacterium]|nr:bifunctional rhamnulose-1-phosphate aldolase/short-chain dehydrogenase [Verrucomicrobiae bacterium]